VNRARLHRVRVLVIEDDATVAAGVSECLAGEGFAVEVAGDGTTGLEQATRGGWSLIVLDIMLPGLNGYRVCKSLRDSGDWTPVLMLTAKSGEFDEAEGLDTGADDFLRKPFSMVVFQARVQALLRRPRRRIDWPAVGDLRLDPLRRRCFRGEIPVPLTPRETEVLALLMDRADSTVTKDEILATVWGREFGGDDNIVEVYVGHLRQKLHDAEGDGPIETVRGEGYRLTTAGPR
jgi:two-component system, OmpR family, response regulator